MVCISDMHIMEVYLRHDRFTGDRDSSQKLSNVDIDYVEEPVPCQIRSCYVMFCNFVLIHATSYFLI